MGSRGKDGGWDTGAWGRTLRARRGITGKLVEKEQREGSSRGGLLREGKLEAAAGPRSAEIRRPKASGHMQSSQRIPPVGEHPGPWWLRDCSVEGAAALISSKEF